VKLLEFTHVLVEVHDFLLPGLSTKLRDRFGASHQIEEVQPRRRYRQDFPLQMPLARFLPLRYLAAFTGDERPLKNFWLWLQPKARVNGHSRIVSVNGVPSSRATQ
jgi:hypothetical protein